MNDQHFTAENKTVIIDGRELKIEIIEPVLTAEENERRTRELGQTLFDVFSKY